MNPTQLQSELFSQLAEPFVGEAVFDCLSDLVFFIKNARGQYVVVNQTLVERCGRRQKNQLIGRRADELFPLPFGESYRAQDESVVKNGIAIRNQLELHFYAPGGRGWCLTNKFPLFDQSQQVVGLVGISKDLQAANERSENYNAVAQVIRYIQKNFSQPLGVRELAQRAGLSRYQFEQRIQKIFQLNPLQLIQKMRMEFALQKLAETGASISEIALDCGYSDQSAFTRKFHQTVGVSPSIYRTQRTKKR